MAMPKRNLRYHPAAVAIQWIVLCLALFAVASGGCGSGGGSGNPSAASRSIDLTPEQVTATSGAAPGYVDDKLCAKCHADLYDSYQHVGMAKSFFRPGEQPVIEDFKNNHGYHDESRRNYKMSLVDGQYIFERNQLDAKRRPINVFRRKVDWVLGSGSTSRNYLYQTESGELYQLPMAWYTQENRWGMAPGFERPDHPGIGRRVERECMFCHNAYPDVPTGSDVYATPQTFPESLPQGIGCQRCHGPGEAHVLAALEDATDPRVLSSIVNPAKLDAARREDVCYQCHLQPSVGLSGVRRFGRGDYSFRPGENLNDYLVQLDVVEAHQTVEERFVINHHPYRLMQSRCFKETEGGISCMACHDPHRAVPEELKVAHYRAACLKCHATDDCTVPPAELHTTKADDCVTCHMPRRRTQDVIHALTTDHRIQRRPSSDFLATLQEVEPAIEDVKFMNPAEAPKGPLAEVYRACAVLRAANWRHTAALAHLEQLLTDNEVNHVEPYLDLAEALIKQRRAADAQVVLEKLQARKMEHPQIEPWLGLALADQGFDDEAMAVLAKVVEAHPDNADAQFNLGWLYAKDQQFDKALDHFEQAVTLRPNMTMAWYYRGNVLAATNRLDEAVENYRQALDIEPAHRRAYTEIRKALMQLGQSAAAFRYWRVGAGQPAIAATSPDQPPEQTAPQNGKIEPLPIPSPPLAGLDPALADQISWGQQLIENAFKYEAPPNEVAAAFGALGQLYHANDLADSAEACYALAAELAPDEYRWPHLLGALHEKADKTDEAIAAYRQAHVLNAEYAPTAIRLGGVYVRLQRWEEASEQFEAALKSNPESAAALKGLGDVALARKQFEQAVERFETVLQKMPMAKGVHAQLAAAYRGLGQEDKAKQHDDDTGSDEVRDPDSLVDNLTKSAQAERIYLACGMFAIGVQRFDVADRVLRKAIETNPDSVQGHVNLGTALVKLDDNIEAIKHYQTALRLDPDNFPAHFNLGLILFRSDEFKRAIEHFEAAVKLRPESAEAKQWLEQTTAKVGGGAADENKSPDEKGADPKD
jgi:predicted CXXCH cytochrome family protein